MAERPISDIVNVTINRQTTTVTRTGFGTALFLAENLYDIDRVETIPKGTWATSLTALGFSSSDAIYLAMQDHFAQTTTPSNAYVGSVWASEQTIQITAYDAATTYTITVTDANGSTPYTSLNAGSAILAAGELATAIAAGSQNVTASNSASDTVTITPDPTGSYFDSVGSVAGGAGTIGTTTTTYEDPDDSLTQCEDFSQDWYAIIAVGTMGRDVAEQKLIADWTETKSHLYIAGTADVNNASLAVGADTATSIGGYCKAQSMKNTSVIYNSNMTALGEYHDAAWLGRCLSADPGSINWNHKNMSSVSADTNITGTYRTNMGNKAVTWYEAVGGVNTTNVGTGKPQNGYGDFIDVTRTVHWIEARIQEGILALEQRVDKIPYTQEGADLIGAEITAVADLGVKNKAIQSTYTVTVPTVSSISSSYKAIRTLPDVVATFPLQGAINDVEVAVTVTV